MAHVRRIEAISAGFAIWRAAERGRFFPWLAVAMAAGVLAYDALTAEPWPLLGAAVFSLAASGALVFRGFGGARAGLLLVAAAGLGFASAQVATGRAAALVEMPRRAAQVSGVVRAVEILPQGRRVLLERPELDGRVLARAVRIRLRNDDPVQVATGDRLAMRALLRGPQPPAYPGGWDLQREAFFAGIGGYGYALGPAARVEEGVPSGLLRWVQALRETVAGRVRAALDGTPGAIAVTLLTGSTGPIPEADRAAFRDSGLAHLLAIAGLHIGIVMAFWFGLVRMVLAGSEYAALHWKLKQIAAAAALAAGGAYLLLTGAHVPIIRSFAMAALVTLGVMVGRRALSLRGLALAMAVIVLIAPWEVGGVSFQMSFSAVLALIAGYEALRRPLARLRGEGGGGRALASHVVALALTSALAGTASAPYAAYHFGHVQIYYVAANMLAVPITAILVMPAGMVALVLMPLHLEALALVPMGWGISAVLWIGQAVSAWPASVLAVPHIPGWGLAVLSLGLAWLGIWRTRWRLAGLAAIVVGVVSPLLARPPDILVSADARLIGVHDAAGLHLAQAAGADRFTRDAWLAWLGARTADALPPCEGACAIAPGVVRLAHEAPAICDGRLMVSAEPIRERCPGGKMIDRFTVWREGAQAVWLAPGGPRILSDRAVRGDRPWVAPLPTAARTAQPGLKAAPAESLPDE